MIGLIINLLLGALPECCYYTLFFSCILNLKEKRGKLLTLIFIAYLLFIYAIPYDILAYFCFSLALYGCLYLLYGKKIQYIDICMSFLAVSYLMITSFVSFAIFGNQEKYYLFAYVIQRVLLFMPFLFHKKIQNLYQKYRTLWNPYSNKSKPIKSITLRILSVIGMCFVCFGMNAFIILILA